MWLQVLTSLSCPTPLLFSAWLADVPLPQATGHRLQLSHAFLSPSWVVPSVLGPRRTRSQAGPQPSKAPPQATGCRPPTRPRALRILLPLVDAAWGLFPPPSELWACGPVQSRRRRRRRTRLSAGSLAALLCVSFLHLHPTPHIPHLFLSPIHHPRLGRPVSRIRPNSASTVLCKSPPALRSPPNT